MEGRVIIGNYILYFPYLETTLRIKGSSFSHSICSGGNCFDDCIRPPRCERDSQTGLAPRFGLTL